MFRSKQLRGDLMMCMLPWSMEKVGREKYSSKCYGQQPSKKDLKHLLHARTCVHMHIHAHDLSQKAEKPKE